MVRLIDSDNPKTYDEYRLDESSFHKKKYSKVMAFVEKNKKFKVLEIGAGTGTYTKFLAKNFPKLIATDLRKEMIDKLNGKKIGVKNIVANCLDLPFKDGVFDIIVGISLFHHITKKEREKFFLEMNRVLKKGGQLVLADPNKLNPFTSVYQFLQGEHAISRFELKKLCGQNGFEIIKISEILARTPSTSSFFDKLPKWDFLEKIAEKLRLGVTVFLVAQKA